MNDILTSENVYVGFVLASPIIMLTVLFIWQKYTEYHIDKQYQERQDDE